MPPAAAADGKAERRACHGATVAGRFFVRWTTAAVAERTKNWESYRSAGCSTASDGVSTARGIGSGATLTGNAGRPTQA